MRIGLINPPASFLIDQKTMPPLGLYTIGAVLNGSGHEVKYIDMACGDELPLATVHEFDAFGVTGTTPQYKEVVSIAEQLRKVGARRLIVGGPHASLEPESLKPYYNTVVVGEGEEVLPGILNCRNHEGIVNAPRIMDLDALPFPDRKQAHRYHYEVGGERASTMFSTRGCPYKCSFCSRKLYGNRTLYRSAQNVILEAVQLKHLGFGGVMFFDDTFTINKKRLALICEGLKELRMKWRCFVRTDTVGPIILKQMVDSGCVEVGVGIESGSDKILKAINKGTSVRQNTQFMDWCKAVGLRVKCFIILGLPGESHETVEESRQWLARNKPENFDITIYQPYPHTEITDYPERFDIKIHPDAYEHLFFKGKPGEYHCSVSTKELSSEDILRYRDEMEREFRS